MAVISSIQAAGYADFMKIAATRWGSVKFFVANVKVQGDGAADQAVRALSYFTQLAELPEVIVLIRGGGSADDLASFNDETLVRAVAESRIPVLTGLGHEVDESLCDLAADRRASTPSNAAELLFPDRRELMNHIRPRVRTAAEAAMRQIADYREKATTSQQEALACWQQRVGQMLNATKLQKQLIEAYNPEVVLQRGYAMVDGALEVGSLITITTKDKIAKARVEKYAKRDDD